MNIELKERINEGELLREKIRKSLSKKDYLVTIYETGDALMACGDADRMMSPRHYFEVCSLEELPEVIKSVGAPHWRHPDLRDGMSKNEISKIPFEEKEWGIRYDLHISPLTEECLAQTHQYESTGVLSAWRSGICNEDETSQTAA